MDRSSDERVTDDRIINDMITKGKIANDMITDGRISDDMSKDKVTNGQVANSRVDECQPISCGVVSDRISINGVRQGVVARGQRRWIINPRINLVPMELIVILFAVILRTMI